MTTAAPPEIPGHEFVSHLGEGGYSDVYLYERRSPRMRVAVKVLKDVRLSSSELAQFEAEAETMAELADHPYIVQVFSADTTADGRPFLIMKYYPQPNLGVRAAAERFTVAETLRTGVKLASAVETAHRAGILHRDIKPANVLVSQYGEPGLTDFGIAGRAAEADDADDIGVSIPWSPPEVLTGQSNGTKQSDVYSLGATLWHLLVGRSPFEVPGGDNSAHALMQRVIRTAPPTTGRADVPAALDRLLQQAMAKNAAVRPRTALEFAQALQGIEQELRLERTSIVVEGLGTSPAAPASRPDTSDRTRTRAATSAGQAAPGRPSDASSRFAPAAPPPTTPATPPASDAPPT
ncbi:MAG: serine/threonine-protein kinase, partial [Jatrophihabitans sp.]|uniref:serine/threonine-protein kinase n=1 Tax=Jatrophihabitans sp. TaxID=1932789 RepID=UPI003F7D1CF9